MELLKLVLRQYFSFSRGERHGIVFLCTLLLLIICINILIGIGDNTPQADPFATADLTQIQFPKNRLIRLISLNL